MSDLPPVTHDPARHRFVVRLDGQEAELNYRQRAGEIELHRTYVPEAFRGRGVAERLGDAAFAYAKAQGLTVIPSCSYLGGAYLSRHPEHRSLVGGAS